MNNYKIFEPIRTAVAVIIALIIAFIVILLVSDDPIGTMTILLVGPLKATRYLGNVIELFIPLAFTGVATAFLFRAKLFNLGAEGILYICGIIATVIAIRLKGYGILQAVVAIGVASVVGMLLGGIPGILKAKWNINELVVSLMFNSIFFGIGFYILNNYLRDTDQSLVASYRFVEPGKLALGNLVAGTRIHYGLILVLIVALLSYVFMFKTKWGYALRMTGANNRFAYYMGIKTFSVIVYTHLIAGFISGMGGAVEVLGMYDRFRWGALPGLGFDGALVALLGKDHPLKALLSALFLAYLRIGADIMARSTEVPSEMIAIIQAIIILLISAERFLAKWREKRLVKEAK